MNFAKFLGTLFLTEHLRWLLLHCVAKISYKSNCNYSSNKDNQKPAFVLFLSFCGSQKQELNFQQVDGLVTKRHANIFYYSFVDTKLIILSLFIFFSFLLFKLYSSHYYFHKSYVIFTFQRNRRYITVRKKSSKSIFLKGRVNFRSTIFKYNLLTFTNREEGEGNSNSCLPPLPSS